MAKDYTICIGTVGQGLWHSPDGGETWQRMRQPFPLESRVRALALHPTEAHTLFAGADSGVRGRCIPQAPVSRRGQRGALSAWP